VANLSYHEVSFVTEVGKVTDVSTGIWWEDNIKMDRGEIG
jgi:hypothetical protein